jgi:hypothetical protein
MGVTVVVIASGPTETIVRGFTGNSMLRPRRRRRPDSIEMSLVALSLEASIVVFLWLATLVGIVS